MTTVLPLSAAGSGRPCSAGSGPREVWIRWRSTPGGSASSITRAPPAAGPRPAAVPRGGAARPGPGAPPLPRVRGRLPRDREDFGQPPDGLAGAVLGADAGTEFGGPVADPRGAERAVKRRAEGASGQRAHGP